MQVQSHALLRRGLGTSVPFIEYLQRSRMMCWCHSLVPRPRPAFVTCSMEKWEEPCIFSHVHMT